MFHPNYHGQIKTNISTINICRAVCRFVSDNGFKKGIKRPDLIPLLQVGLLAQATIEVVIVHRTIVLYRLTDGRRWTCVLINISSTFWPKQFLNDVTPQPTLGGS